MKRHWYGRVCTVAAVLCGSLAIAGQPSIAQTGGERYRDHIFTVSTDLFHDRIVDPVANPTFEGNYIIRDSFDALDQGISGTASTLPLKQLRSSYGLPWSQTASSAIVVVDPDDVSPTDPHVTTDQAATAWAPTAGKNLAHYWSGISEVVKLPTPITESAMVDPVGDGIDLLFGVNQKNPSSYYYLKVKRGAPDTLTLGESGSQTSLVKELDLPDVGAFKVDVDLDPVEATQDTWSIPLTVSVNGTVAWSTQPAGEPPTEVPLALDLLNNGSPLADASLEDRTAVGFTLSANSTIDDFSLMDPLRAKVVVPDPEVDTATNRPVLLALHGGASQTGTEVDLDDWLQDFSKRGYVAVGADYRTRLGLKEEPSLFAANSHKFVVPEALSTWDLELSTLGDITGSVVVTDLGWNDAPSVLEGVVNSALAMAGSKVRVDVWRPSRAVDGEYWFTWASYGRLPLPTVEVAAEVWRSNFQSFEEQILATQLCSSEYIDEQESQTPRDWITSPTSDDDTCFSRHFDDRYYCAAVADQAYPSEATDCDQGVATWVEQIIAGPALDDVQTYVRWLKDSAINGQNPYGIDPDQIYATGWSAGAHLSWDLAADPQSVTRPRHDPPSEPLVVPYPTVSNTIAGAAPHAASHRLLGDGSVPTWSAPVAAFDHDIDGYFDGGMLAEGRALQRGAWAQGTVGEINGWCGKGHRVGSKNEVARFFYSLIVDEPALLRGGLEAGPLTGPEDLQALDTGRQQMIGQPDDADPRPYQDLVGDFDGDGIDDLYFHEMSTSATRCDSLWLGASNGTFRPTPLMDDTSRVLPTTQGVWDQGVQLADPYIVSPVGAEPKVADFNGDGRDDIFWYQPDSSQHELWQILDPDPLDDQDALESGTCPRAENPCQSPDAHKLPLNLFNETPVDVGGVYDQVIVGNFTDRDTDPGTPEGADVYFLDKSGDLTDKLLAFGTSGGVEEEASSTEKTLPADFVQSSTPADPQVGNFNGDDRDDIFWYTPGATSQGATEDAFWYGAATDPFTSRITHAVWPYHEVLVGNFGDPSQECSACDDLFMWDADASTGFNQTDVLYYGKAFSGGNPQLPETYIAWDSFDPQCREEPDYSRIGWAVGKFNDDDWDDVLWHGQGHDLDRIHYGRPNTELAAWGESAFDEVVVGLNGKFDPLAGDFNGDGKDDIHFIGGDVDANGGAETVLFADDMEGDASYTLLANHTPDIDCSGSGWMTDSSYSMMIYNDMVNGQPAGKAIRNTSTPARELAWLGQSTDYRMNLTVDSYFMESPQVILRYNDAQNYVALRWEGRNDSLGRMSLVQVVNGTATVLVTSGAVVGTSPTQLEITSLGPDVEVRASINGAAWIDLLSGATTVDTTDWKAFGIGQQAGWFQTRFDDIRVTAFHT